MVDRESLIRRFNLTAQSALPDNAVIANKPDHPLLFSGPDVLIGNRGTLMAVFFVKTRELLRPKELTARLVASRLALPGHTTCILVRTGAESKNHSIFDQFDFTFERVLRPNEITEAMSDVAKSKERRSYLSKVREEAHVNYSALLHVQRLQTAREDEDTVTRRSYEGASQIGTTWHGSKKIRQYQDSLIGLKRTDTKSKLVSAIQEYAIQSFNENYELHEGVPEPRRKSLDVAAYESLPSVGLDPEKPLRVAAFSGWILTDAEEILHNASSYLEDTQRLLENARSRIWAIQRRKYSR